MLHPEFLDDFYARHRGRCYEDLLTFPTIVALTRDALVLHKGSALPALERADERGDLPTCQEAFYGKLRRIPPELSEAFLGEATARLARSAARRRPAPRPCPRRWTSSRSSASTASRSSGVAKRLKPARGRPGKLIGGKILVAYLPRTGLAVAMAAERDGEANDIRLMPRAVPAGPRPHRRAAALGGRPPVLRPRPAGAVVRGGRPLPAAPLAEAGLRTPTPTGRRGSRSTRGAAGRRAVGLDRGGEPGRSGGGTCGRSTWSAPARRTCTW